MRMTEVRPSRVRNPLGLTLLLTAVAVTSVTPLAQLGAGLLVLTTLISAMTLRRHVSVAAIVLSTLFVSESVMGLRTPLLILAALSVGTLLSFVAQPHALRLQMAIVPFAALVVFAVNFIVRAPTTIVAGFAVYEQGVVIALATVLSISVETGSSTKNADAFHYALCATALVGGINALLSLATVSEAIASTRSVSSVFGASNYVAALLTVATVACVHRAVSGRSVWLNASIAIACVGLALPQASRTSSIVLAVILLVLLSRKVAFGKSLFVAITVLVLSPIFLSQLPVMARFQTDSLSTTDLNGRVALWHFAIGQIESHGLLGIGPGNLTAALQSAGVSVFYVHDIWLSWIAQYGIFSILLFVVILRPITHRARDDYTAYLAVTLLLISTLEPAVETLMIGIIYVCLLTLHFSPKPTMVPTGVARREVLIHDHGRSRISL